MRRQKCLTEAYYYALCRFALNYYMFCESCEERQALSGEIAEFEKGLMESVMRLLEETEYLQSGPREGAPSDEAEHGLTALRLIGALRDKTIKNAELVLFYMDCIKIYEYAFSRQEGRFFPKQNPGMSEEHLARALVKYVRNGGSQLELVQRIQQVMEELPARYTKIKFYSLIENSLMSYIGTSKRAFSEALFSIKSAAGLPEAVQNTFGSSPFFESVQSLCRELEQTDYQALTRESFEAKRAEIEKAMEKDILYSDFLLSFAEMVNCLYAAALALPEAEAGSEKRLTELISGILESQRKGKSPMLEEYLEELEGTQEYYGELYLRKAGRKDTCGDGAIKKISHQIQQLLSSSHMALLSEEEDESLTQGCFRDELDRLFESLSGRLSVCSKATRRALMARVLSVLPVWFQSTEELGQYIVESLKDCTDPLEKAVCMERLSEWMVDGDALV